MRVCGACQLGLGDACEDPQKTPSVQPVKIFRRQTHKLGMKARRSTELARCGAAAHPVSQTKPESRKQLSPMEKHGSFTHANGMLWVNNVWDEHGWQGEGLVSSNNVGSCVTGLGCTVLPRELAWKPKTPPPHKEFGVVEDRKFIGLLCVATKS